MSHPSRTPPHTGLDTAISNRARVGRLRAELGRHMSAMVATGTVNAALGAAGITEEQCSPEQFWGLVSRCRAGLALFVAPDRLPPLMLALAELVELEGREPEGAGPPSAARPRVKSSPGLR